VAVVGSLVQKKETDSTKRDEIHKTIHKNIIHKIENKKRIISKVSLVIITNMCELHSFNIIIIIIMAQKIILFKVIVNFVVVLLHFLFCNCVLPPLL
jgi:uncharacterized membrane protein